MRFNKVILGNLEWKIFFVAHPWWQASKINSAVIFVRKTYKSFLMKTKKKLTLTLFKLHKCKLTHINELSPVFHRAWPSQSLLTRETVMFHTLLNYAIIIIEICSNTFIFFILKFSSNHKFISLQYFLFLSFWNIIWG